jgi:hypothetical protein
MREEQEAFHRQRAEMLKDGTGRHTVEEEMLFYTILLAITSPLWLMILFINNIYCRARGRHRLAYLGGEK